MPAAVVAARGAWWGKAREVPLVRESEKEALARTLWAETSGLERHPDEELAAIAWVARNRAAQDGATIEKVLGPPGSSKQGVWNNSTRFRERWEAARGKPGWDRCYEVAERVLLSPSARDPIAGRNMFFHFGGLPSPDGGRCTSPRRFLMVRGGAQRCAPLWARNSPLQIGKATFTYSKSYG